MILRDVLIGSAMNATMIELIKYSEPFGESVRTDDRSLNRLPLSNPHSDFFGIAFPPVSAILGDLVGAPNLERFHSLGVVQFPFSTASFNLFFVTLIPFGILLFVFFGIGVSPFGSVGTSTVTLTRITRLVVVALSFLAFQASTAFAVCRHAWLNGKIVIGQGVGLHHRLTNWLGSFGAATSFEPS